jgi:hypothetical protein
MGEGLRVESCERMFFGGDVVGVDVGWEDAVGEVDFCVGCIVCAVDIEHRKRGLLKLVYKEMHRTGGAAARERFGARACGAERSVGRNLSRRVGREAQPYVAWLGRVGM